MKDDVLHAIECDCPQCTEKWNQLSNPKHELAKLFYGENYYPSGGFEDFKAYFNSIELAKLYVETELKDEACMWCHIVVDDKIVLKGRVDGISKKSWEWEIPE